MNYLDLTRRVALESGTIPESALPATLAGAGGRVGLMAGWVRQAWVDIQNARSAWLWMRREWEGSLSSGVQRYSPADLGVVRFAEWIHVTHDHVPMTTLYRTSLGASDEGRISYMAWPKFYTKFLRGVAQESRPGWYSVDDQQRLVFSPTPDAAYTVRGMYRVAPQVLANDADTPEMPERFHYVIALHALVYLATHDEAASQFPIWQMQLQQLMGDLTRDQLPMMRIEGGPLA